MSDDCLDRSGANLDDKGDYRPGLTAASERAIRHPLLECSINKATIRALAEYFGLPNYNKPASPCLSSRIPYGQRVTREKLSQIEHGEAWLQQHGFPISRIRHYGNEAIIEVPTERVSDLENQRPALEAELKTLGWTTITIDPEGFVSGKLNRALDAF